MKGMSNSMWLIAAVSLGLFAYSLTAIAFNGFAVHLTYPLILGIINLAALQMVRKGR